MLHIKGVFSMGENIFIRDISEDERPRERLLKKGEKYLSNSELLAIILGTGTKKKSSIDLANEIITTFGGIKYLSNISAEQLSLIKGVGLAKASNIIAALELGKRVAVASKEEGFKISSPQDVGNIYMDEMMHLKKEIFKIVLLDTKNKIISDKIISEGSLNASIVHPREVFIEAIKKSSNKIILIHNHPSGEIEPSSEDKAITRRLVEAGKIIGIEVLDHVIIGNHKFYSFKEDERL